MTKPELILQESLLATGIVIPRQSSTKGGRIDVLCRPVPGSDRPLMSMIDQLLAGAEEALVTVHVCKRFVRKNGKMAFGWNFTVEAKSSKELMGTMEKVKQILEVVTTPIEPVTAPPVVASEQTPAPAPVHQPQYKTDQQVAHQVGITVDPQAGRLGRLAPDRSTTQYEVGVRLDGPRISLVQSGRDSNGKPIVVAEMPLPHVKREMNVPNDKGRGAYTIGSFRAGR